MKSGRLILIVASLLLPTVAVQAAVLEEPKVAPATEVSLLSASDAPLGVAPSAALVCAPIPTGVVAWWRAQSNTVDAVGINDILFDALPPRSSLYTVGKVGAAFRLTTSFGPYSTTNALWVPPSADLDVGSGAGLTIEGWLSPSSVTGVQPVAEWNDGHGNIGAALALNGAALEVLLTDTNASPARRIIFRSAPSLFATSVWHHVALTFDKAAGQATAYVDGVAVAQTNLGAFRPATQAPMYLGTRPSGTNGGAYYAGLLDELAIYNRALAVAELQALVAADSAGKCVPPPPLPVPPPSGFVGWWRGESNVLDSVDANNGVVVNSVSYVDGVVGKAFRSYDGYVRIPAATNLNLGLGPGFTVEAWILPGASGGWPVSTRPNPLAGIADSPPKASASCSLASPITSYSSLSPRPTLFNVLGC